MGRKKLSAEEKRSYVVMVRFKPNVRQVIEAAFRASGEKTISAWVRRVVWEAAKESARVPTEVRIKPEAVAPQEKVAEVRVVRYDFPS